MKPLATGNRRHIAGKAKGGPPIEGKEVLSRETAEAWHRVIPSALHPDSQTGSHRDAPGRLTRDAGVNDEEFAAQLADEDAEDELAEEESGGSLCA